jgi:hypothetical protein
MNLEKTPLLADVFLLLRRLRENCPQQNATVICCVLQNAHPLPQAKRS